MFVLIKGAFLLGIFGCNLSAFFGFSNLRCSSIFLEWLMLLICLIFGALYSDCLSLVCLHCRPHYFMYLFMFTHRLLFTHIQVLV